MYAITLRQPMATAVMHLGKTTENRTDLRLWRHLAGRRIAIHAGLKWEDHYAAEILGITGRHLTEDDIPRGAILGTVDVTDVHYADEDCCPDTGWQEMQNPPGTPQIVHLTLDLPRPVPPIDCRGRQGAWVLPHELERLVQLG